MGYAMSLRKNIVRQPRKIYNPFGVQLTRHCNEQQNLIHKQHSKYALTSQGYQRREGNAFDQ